MCPCGGADSATTTSHVDHHPQYQQQQQHPRSVDVIIRTHVDQAVTAAIKYISKLKTKRDRDRCGKSGWLVADWCKRLVVRQTTKLTDCMKSRFCCYELMSSSMSQLTCKMAPSTRQRGTDLGAFSKMFTLDGDRAVFL